MSDKPDVLTFVEKQMRVFTVVKRILVTGGIFVGGFALAFALYLARPWWGTIPTVITGKTPQEARSVVLEKGGYTVEIGYFYHQEEAQNFMKAMQQEGVHTALISRKDNKITTYHVICGDYASKEAAMASARYLMDEKHLIAMVTQR